MRLAVKSQNLCPRVGWFMACFWGDHSGISSTSASQSRLWLTNKKEEPVLKVDGKRPVV
jgi:hypothetical protein